jgi:hypothetical protein
VKCELHYFHDIDHGGHPWQTGDWLINYKAGFIRRGLIGEIFLILSEISTIPLLVVAFSVQSSILFLCFFYHFRTVRIVLENRMQKQTFLLISLLLSPAGILFEFYNLDFSFRKEIMGLAIFNWLVFRKISQRKFSNSVWIASLIFYTIFVLSWEAGMIVSIFIISVLPRNVANDSKFKFKSRMNSRVMSFLVINVACATLSFFYRGTIDQKYLICESLVGEGKLDSQICGGGIDAISWNLHYFASGSTVNSPIRLLGFTFLLICSFLPFFGFGFIGNHKILITFSMLGYIFFNSLAADTGRIIFILSFCSLNLLLHDLSMGNESIRNIFLFQKKNIVRNIMQFVVLFIYTFLWFVPASGSPWRFMKIHLPF